VARQVADALVHVAAPQRFHDAYKEHAPAAAPGAAPGAAPSGRNRRARWNSGGHVRAPQDQRRDRKRRLSGGADLPPAEADGSLPRILRISVSRSASS
jgi:hypothetical protein